VEGQVTLVGREQERGRLRDLVATVATSRTRAIVIEGEPGIGKSRLAVELADIAVAQGFSVLWGAGDQIECDRPFGPLAAALELDGSSTDPHRRALAELLYGDVPERGPAFAAHVPDARYRVIDGCTALLERRAGVAPTLLVVDDLQWADASTALALAVILRRVRDLPLLVACTSRMAPRSDAVERAVEAMLDAGALRMVLEPLRTGQTVALAAAALGADLGPRLTAMVGGTGGNPLFALELVDDLRGQGQLVHSGTSVELTDSAAARDFGRRVLTRVGRMSADATLLVQVGAVLGSTFALDEVAAVSGLSLARLLPAVAEARGAGLVEERAGEVSFRHDLLRQTVYDGIASAARTALHRGAGRVLADRGAPSSRVARHLVLGAEPGDREAVRWLHDAGRRAGPRAPQEALQLLREASALAGRDHPDRLALLADQAEVLGWSGELPESESLALEVLAASDDPVQRRAMHRQVGVCLFLRNRAAEAAHQADALAAEETTVPERARAQAEASLAYMAAGQRDLALERAEVGAASGDGISVCLGESVLSRYQAFDLDFAGSLTRADAALRAAEADPTGEVDRYQPAFFRLLTLLDLDRHDDVAAELVEARRRTAAVGASWAVPLYHGVAAVRHLMRGELDDALAESTAGLVVVEEVGSPLADIWLHAVSAMVALEQGRTGGAADLVAAAEAKLATNVPLLGLDLLLLARALVEEASGRREIAAESLATACDLFVTLGFYGNLRIVGPSLVRISLVAGQRDRAETTAEELARVAKATGLPTDEGAALLAAGQCAGDPALVLDAVAAYRRGCRPLWLARCCETAAPVVWGTGDVALATALLGESYAICERTGAQGSTERVAQLCRDLGIRRARPRNRPTSGWESLTDSEKRVAALVGEGATNQVIAERLAISRRTVETHLSHAYSKLEIVSRVELALFVERRT